jgi:hypothetical protein
MKKVVFKIAVLPVLCVLVLASGCVYDDLSSEMVVTETVKISLDEYRTSPTLGSAVVCDDFADRVYKLLEKHDTKVKDIRSIHIVSGTYMVQRLSSDHDWTISSAVTIKRRDVSDGPATFVNMTDQSLMAAEDMAIYADLNSDGIALVDRALDDLVSGGNPELVLTMEGGSVTPEPTMMDPLDFKWRVAVTFQVVVDKNPPGRN